MLEMQTREIVPSNDAGFACATSCESPYGDLFGVGGTITRPINGGQADHDDMTAA